MPLTYSINVGSVTEADTRDNISDILTLLNDNTQNDITPRDIRDSVFSLWENTIFRYTLTDTSDSYIGIDRTNIKDKIFFGKKELSGTTIITSTLLSTDTDIFFYNTKSDALSNQDLKISFLSGGNRLLDEWAPYISVGETSSVYGDYLNFNIIHTNPIGGDFTFLAGTAGNISLNSLVFPSKTILDAQILAPAAIDITDTFLVRTVSGNIELKSATFSSTTIPTFSDVNLTPVEFGGIPAGTSFSNIALIEMFRSLLYPVLGPLVELQDLGYRERNDLGDIVPYTYTLTKRVSDITSTDIVIDGPSPIITPFTGSVITGSGFQTITYNATQSFTNTQIVNSDNPPTGAVVSFTFSISTTDGTQSTTASSTLKYVYPYFYGYSATTSHPEAQISSGTFSKLVADYGSQSVPLSGSEWLHYCYPSIYGVISEIIDGNGFIIYQSGSASWTYSVVTTTSPDSYWGPVDYLVYRRVIETTIPSTQNYQFNF